MYSVYRHTCPDGKVYIGITGLNPKQRWGRNGILYKGQAFYKAIEEYGWQSIKHEVLYTGLTREEAERKEIELIEAYNCMDPEKGFNKAEGGYTHRHTTETRQKMSRARKGVPHSTEHNRAVSEALKGSTISESHRKSLSESHKGYRMPESQKTNISKGCQNKGIKAVVKCGPNGEELEIFKSLNDAAAAVGAKSTSNISSCCRGKRPNANGYLWRYA